MTEQQHTGPIKQVPALDLSHLTSPEELAAITGIFEVAMVLVPESLAGAIWRIPMEKVGAVIPVRDGARVSIHTGAITLGGDALAEPGDNDVLVVTGALLITTPVSKVGYRQVIVTGSVLAPYGSESALGGALSKVTGSIDYFRYAEGQRIDQQAGQVNVSGEYLANPRGTADDILTVGGQLVVTSPVATLGYQRVYVGGMIIAPRDSRTVIESALTVAGKSVWYGGHNPRFFTGHQTFGNDFFELVDDPMTMVLNGDIEFEPDVSPDLVRAKVHEIVLLASVTVSQPIAALIQFLAVENHGQIQIRSDVEQTEPVD